MPSTNIHVPKRAILYARVSTQEQARSGYSLAQQLEALREYAAREGYEVLEQVTDPGQSGASLERPGMDRVRDLVQAGGVSVVLAQDRDRFSREPAYVYVLKKEFEERSCSLRSLNCRGDDSPEDELTEGILDQLARYERAKIAERSRRGKQRMASEGNVVAGPHPVYGFRYTEDRKSYEVDEAKMRVVRRIFQEVVEGKTLRSIKRGLDKDGIPTPRGGRFWSHTCLKQLIAHDAYRPHTCEEIKGLVNPDVAVRLNPNKSYGIWWYGRKRHHQAQKSENGPDGRTYHKTKKTVWLDREKWIAVPVPDCGIPRERVDAARERVKNNRPAAKTGARFWELSGGIWRCGSCGRAMSGNRVGSKGRKRFYYRCPNYHANGAESCPNNKNYRAEKIEGEVWAEISSLLKEPERLRAGVERMLEAQRRGDPEREMRIWAKRLVEIDAKRSRYQDMAAEDLIDFDELRAKLDDLEVDRKTAAHELETIRHKAERLASLSLETEALVEAYSSKALTGLNLYTPQDKFDAYKALGLKVIAHANGTTELTGGSLCSNEKSLSLSALTRPHDLGPVFLRAQDPIAWADEGTFTHC
jgi:site-specific DNA recombinase